MAPEATVVKRHAERRDLDMCEKAPWHVKRSDADSEKQGCRRLQMKGVKEVVRAAQSRFWLRLGVMSRKRSVPQQKSADTLGSSNGILGRVVTGRKGSARESARMEKDKKGKGKVLTCCACGGVGHDARLCPGGGWANSLNEKLGSGEG